MRIRPFDIFMIRREEMRPAAVAMAVITVINALFVYKMYGAVTPLCGDREMTARMFRYFHVSGYDPLTLVTISSWSDVYNVYRHPLLAFIISPLSLLNEWLGVVTGLNCALFITAVMMAFCAFYSFVFLRRIFTDVLCLKTLDADILCALFFSFAYVMVICFAPDHFGFSMCMLLLVLYVAGMRMRRGKLFPTWQMAVLFTFATGVTTNNCVKAVLAQLFVNGKRFFRVRNMLLGVALPAVALWMFSRYEYKTYVWPGEKAKHEARMKRKAAKAKADSVLAAKYANGDSATRARLAPKMKKRSVGKKKAVKSGRPFTMVGLMQWSDATTPRLQTVVENFFGEPMQFHRKHFLEDVFHRRPVFVGYDWAANYVVEALLALLFLGGVVCGWRSRFLWLALSWLGCDIVLHLVLGFGINEVYIMSPHWLFVFPVAMAFMVRRAGRWRPALRAALLCLTAWLWAYNGWLLGGFLLTPAA